MGGTEPFWQLYGADCEEFRAVLARTQFYRSQGRIPEELIPIGDNMFGDQVCLAVLGEHRGKVFFWDHDDERDEADYWQEHGQGKTVPREFLYGNVYLVADSFMDFLARLVRDEQ